MAMLMVAFRSFAKMGLKTVNKNMANVRDILVS